MGKQCKLSDFIYLFIFGSKITADGDCSHEIIYLLLGRQVMTNLDSIFKSRDITLKNTKSETINHKMRAETAT